MPAANTSISQDLPYDILNIIFLDCFPITDTPQPTLDLLTITTGKSTPVILSHICSHWRRCALSTALLWARFHVLIPDSPKSSSPRLSFRRLSSKAALVAIDKKLARYVHEHIYRSQGQPLSIYISCRLDLQLPAARYAMHRVFEELNKHADCWTSLEVAAYDRCVRPLLYSLRLATSPLQKLKIHRFSSDAILDWTEARWLRPTPHLSSLHFVNCKLDIDNTVEMQPQGEWRNPVWGLRGNGLGFLDWESRLPNLEHLDISLDRIMPEILLTNRPDFDVDDVLNVSLPRLLTLKVASSGDMPYTPLCVLFRALQTPSLRFLELSLWKEKQAFSFLGPWVAERQSFTRDLQHFIQRCNQARDGALHHLSVTSPWLSSAGLLTLLPDLQFLQRLTVKDFSMPNSIVEALSLLSTGSKSNHLRPRFSPLLRRIDLSVNRNLSQDTLVNLLLLRSTSNSITSELQEVNITCEDNCLPAFLENPMVALSIASGLQVRLTRHSGTPPNGCAVPSATAKTYFGRRRR